MGNWVVALVDVVFRFTGCTGAFGVSMLAASLTALIVLIRGDGGVAR